MDWTCIIKDLALDYPQKELALYSGLAESAITRMKAGTLRRVSYEAGCKLVELHTKWQRRQRRAGK